MSADVGIEAWLSENGYTPEAREVLIEAGVLNAHKSRMSVEKLPKAQATLEERLVRHCHRERCRRFALTSGRQPVATERLSACEHCHGSANEEAASALVAAGLERLVIVGGTPATREELRRLLGHRLELRLIDGTVRRPVERAKADLLWADRVLLWGATELHHKVSKQYADAPGGRGKVIHIPKRGVAQLLEGALGR